MSKKVMNGLDLTGQKIENLGDPSNAADAANKQYVDNVARGLTFKQAARASSTGPVTLSGPGASIDGVALANGDRVLVKNQASASENGIYVFNGAASALTRALDADDDAELNPGTAVYVTEGTANGDSLFVIVSDDAITVGTTDMTFGEIGGGTTYTASNGAQIVGTDIRAVAAPSGGLTVGAQGIAIDQSIVPRKFSANIGNGSATSIVVTHNLGTLDVNVAVREIATQEGVLVDWVATDANTVTLTFATAPAANAFRASIVG